MEITAFNTSDGKSSDEATVMQNGDFNKTLMIYWKNLFKTYQWFSSIILYSGLFYAIYGWLEWCEKWQQYLQMLFSIYV